MTFDFEGVIFVYSYVEVVEVVEILNGGDINISMTSVARDW